MVEDVAFWQTRVKVSQIPSVLPTQEILDPRTKLLVKTDKSWLCDPFMPSLKLRRILHKRRKLGEYKY